MKALVAVAALLAGSAASGQSDDILAKAINRPGANYTVIGVTQTNRWVKDGKVAGGQAMRVEVTAAGTNAYAVQAVSPLSKPIVKGHHITVAVWIRAPKAKANETLPIGFFGVIGGPPSYTPVATGKAEVGADWKLVDATGAAPADFTVNSATVVVHLAAAEGVFDLGPVFVIDRDAGR
jgi:hypothetical protein